jgi:MFS family permease
MQTPWYFGWNVLAVGLVFQAVLFGSVHFSYTMWVNQWVADPTLDASLGQAMWAITVLTVTQGLLAPFAGRAMDRRSIRGLVCAGALAAACGFVVISQATAFWQIILVYGTLVMIGTLLAGPLAAQTLAAKWFRGRRGLAIGLSTIGTSIGGFVLAPFVAHLYLTFGWRTAHVLLAGIMLLVVVPLVWMVVRNTPGDRGIAIEPDHAQLLTDAPASPAAGLTTWDILRNRDFWVVVVAFTPMVTAFGGVQQNLAPFARDHAIDDAAIALLISIFSGVMIAGKVFFGAMADRFDHRGLYFLAVAMLFATLVLMSTGPTFPLMVLVCICLGFAAGGFLPIMGAIVSSRFGPASFGQVLGLIGPFTTLSAIGPPLAGQLRESTGNYDLALLIFAVLMVPAIGGMLALRARRGVLAPAPGSISSG